LLGAENTPANEQDVSHLPFSQTALILFSRDGTFQKAAILIYSNLRHSEVDLEEQRLNSLTQATRNLVFDSLLLIRLTEVNLFLPVTQSSTLQLSPYRLLTAPLGSVSEFNEH